MKSTSIFNYFSRILHSAKYIVFVCCVCLVVVSGGGTTSCAELLKSELTLISYNTLSSQPQWIEDGMFSASLKQDSDIHKTNYLAKQTNFVLNNTMNSLKKKIRFTFSPKIIIKPFFVVQELQDLLVIYQSKKQRKDIHIDEKFQAKVLIQPFKMSYLQKISRRKPFSVAPYHNKIYGLHLQIAW